MISFRSTFRPMLVVPLLFLASLAPGEVHAEVFGDSFGFLNLQIRSNSNSEPREFLSDLLGRTSSFLDKQLSASFDATVAPDWFSHVGLSVLTYSVDDTISSQTVASVEFDSTAFFTARPTPGKEFIVDVVKDAFQGDSRLEYVRELQKSEIDLLKDMTYLVVGINDKIVANEDLTLGGMGSSGNGIVENGFPPSGSESPSPSNLKTQVAIIAGLCAGAACLIILSVCIIIKNRRRTRHESEAKPIVIRRDPSTDIEHDLEGRSTRSPSPIRSICSQESSKFTYNPRDGYASSTIDGNSTIGGSTIDSKTIPSNFSSLQVDVASNGVDVEAWKNSTISPITPAPFGHDISAIDKKDLSLIEEGTDEENTPASRVADTYLNKKMLSRLEYKDVTPVKWRSKVPKVASSSSSKPKFLNDSWYSEDDSSQCSDGSDVIRDLNNLSRQIRRKRATLL